MYKASVLEAALEGARAAVLEDRKRFVPFLRAAEEVAIGQSAILGTSAMELLVKAEPSYVLDFYATNPLQIARAMAQAMYDTGAPGHELVALHTQIENEVFTIAADARQLVTVSRIRRTERQAVIPIEVRGAYGGRRLLAFPMELLLLDVYARLSDPARVEEWPELLERERRLRERFISERETRIQVAGGRAAQRSATRHTAAQLRDTLRRDFVGTDRAAVEMPDREVLVFLSARPLREEYEAIARILNADGKVVLSSDVKDLNVPGEPQHRRLVIKHYAQSSRDRWETLAYVFNVPALEAVPVVRRQASRAVAAVPAAMRIVLNLFWVIKIVYQRSPATQDFIERVMRGYADTFQKLGRVLDRARAGDAAAIAECFPSTYIGVWHDKVVELQRRQRRLAKESTRRYYDWYPYMASAKANAEAAIAALQTDEPEPTAPPPQAPDAEPAADAEQAEQASDTEPASDAE